MYGASDETINLVASAIAEDDAGNTEAAEQLYLEAVGSEHPYAGDPTPLDAAKFR